MVGAGSRPRREPALAKYEVLEELGHGGMATVYRAHDRRLGRDVAVKVLHPHLKESREIAHRFAVEARAVAKLRHPNIVEVFDVSSEDEQEQYLVVELVRGRTLRALLQDVGALPPEIAAALAAELLAALAHAHAHGVVHRDVKPENVLLEHRPSPEHASEAATPEGGAAPESERPSSGDPGSRFSVKLTDFGIAKLLDAQGVTSTGQVLGSPAHMAPEQIEGGEVDGRADVFGIGVLLYECMVGHLPFEGKNPAQVLRRVLDGAYASAEHERPTIGQIWSRIVDRALARDPADRFQDAQALRESLLAELERTGFGPSNTGSVRVLLERYFDDPEGFRARQETELVKRLCALGKAASKRGDALGAAADYNRALAYRPDDPELLRIVGTMHRSQARLRVVRRVASLLLFVVSLGTAAFVVARGIKTKTTPDVVAPTETTSPTSSTPEARPTSSTPKTSTPTSESTSPRAAATEHKKIIPLAPVRPTPPPDVNAPRVLTLAAVQPANGVFVAIDGAAKIPAVEQGALHVDRRAHRLVFSCANDLCEPAVQEIAAGEDDVTLSDVALRIHPARLVVEGESTHTYGIFELPNLVLTPGIEAEVPMIRGDRIVTVFDRVDPTVKKQEHKLVANQRKVVTFASGSP